MSTTQKAPAPTVDFETRDAKGEWRPPYPVTYAPLLSWPPRPLAILKWVVSYPGFMLPNNLFLLSISALSWYFTQPALSRCVHFRWDWIAQVYVRNIGLIWLIFGGYYLLMYGLKLQGTKAKYNVRWPAKNSRMFLFGNQLHDNIFWTCGVGGLVWTGYEVITLWMYANHRIPWLRWSQHPVYFVLWIVVIPFWREVHFYWVHRFIHWKPMYRYVHYLHHKNTNPNPWSGMAMHPVELLLYFSVCLIHWVIPSHPFHFLFDLQHCGLAPAGGHLGFEGPILDGKWPTGSYFHYLHHKYFECNYGESTLPLDKWFGTFRDGMPGGSGAKLPEEHKI